MNTITKKNLTDKKLIDEAEKLMWEVSSVLHLKRVGMDSDIAGIISCYMIYKLIESGNEELKLTDFENGKVKIKESVASVIREMESHSEFTDEIWDSLKEIGVNYSKEAVALAILRPITSNPSRSAFNETSDSVIRLAESLLNLCGSQKIADICCGAGMFLSRACLDNPKAVYVGYEINIFNKAVADVRAELTGDNVTVLLQDVFAKNDEEPYEKYDRIFSEPPFGVRMQLNSLMQKYVSEYINKIPEIKRISSSDWAFVLLQLEMLKDDGKAICLITNGSTWNQADKQIRQYLIENGFIETVISLPGKMIYGTNIATSMLVLSKGNETVRIVDATKLYSQGRRINEFTDNNIEEIVKAANKDGKYSKSISIEKFAENEYSLNFDRYMDKEIEFIDGAPFESIIESITRGAPCTASQLDEMASGKPTNYQYLMLSNIRNGIIDQELPYLQEIDKKYDKYCLENQSLIISKNGAPFKVAVADFDDRKKILANGNLFVIKINKEKANPHYIQAFFNSDKGKAALKSITVGATIPNIGIESLKRLIIPIPSLEEQERIAEKFQACVDEIAVLRIRIAKAEDKLSHIFDEEVDG